MDGQAEKTKRQTSDQEGALVPFSNSFQQLQDNAQAEIPQSDVSLENVGDFN